MADGAIGVIQAGLVGRGIQGSRSPAMHMDEATSNGLRLSYVLLDLDQSSGGDLELAETLDGAERNGFSGLNITYPFKQAVMPLLWDLAPDARRLGAVNTVVFRNGRRFGHNTDWSGFAESFRRGLPGVDLGSVVQIGAGGAGAAVAYALLEQGVERLTIVDLDSRRADDLVTRLKDIFSPDRAISGDDLSSEVSRADGIVNATPIGMTKYPGTPLSVDLLRPRHWVAEVVYFPIETALLRAARQIGCRTLDGGGMAVFQAAEAFQLFTGVAPDADRMRARFLRDVERSEPSEVSMHD